MKRGMSYIRLLTAVYIMMYLLLNSVFVHSHVIDGEIITHSHPFTANQHTSAEASIIKIYNSTTGISECLEGLPEHTAFTCTSFQSLYVNLYSYNYSYFEPHRGPPHCKSQIHIQL